MQERGPGWSCEDVGAFLCVHLCWGIVRCWRMLVRLQRKLRRQSGYPTPEYPAPSFIFHLPAPFSSHSRCESVALSASTHAMPTYVPSCLPLRHARLWQHATSHNVYVYIANPTRITCMCTHPQRIATCTYPHVYMPCLHAHAHIHIPHSHMHTCTCLHVTCLECQSSKWRTLLQVRHVYVYRLRFTYTLLLAL
jgi:hypothetical protein